MKSNPSSLAAFLLGLSLLVSSARAAEPAPSTQPTLDELKNELNERKAQLDAALANNAELVKTSEVSLAQAAQSQKDAAGRIEEQNAQITALTRQQTLLVVSQKQSDAQVKVLRDEIGKLVVQHEEDSLKIAELTSQLEAAAIDRGEQRVKPFGPATRPAGDFQKGSPEINGLITEVKAFNGMTMVTMNVGTIDGVVVGTEFNILDDKGNFLGFVKVDHVDNNLSIGKFSGADDKLKQVKPSNAVRAKLKRE